jgi:hypothetical protein
MRQARDLFVARMPHIPADGEMQGDAALSEAVRAKLLPDSTLNGTANILICPNLDAANILFNVLKMTGGNGITVGPILLGAAAPVHILNAVGHGAPHREHDGGGRGARQGVKTCARQQGVRRARLAVRHDARSSLPGLSRLPCGPDHGGDLGRLHCDLAHGGQVRTDQLGHRGLAPGNGQPGAVALLSKPAARVVA